MDNRIKIYVIANFNSQNKSEFKKKIQLYLHECERHSLSAVQPHFDTYSIQRHLRQRVVITRDQSRERRH